MALEKTMIDPHAMAVALTYSPEDGRLPRVTAKGRGRIAAQIEAVAVAHGIPVTRDGDLAAILEQLDLEAPIPTVAFAAVAEILAALYRANGQAGASA